MVEDSKMIKPDGERCFPYYPSDRDVAIQMVNLASQILNRKNQNWDMPPVMMPMDMDAKEKEKIRRLSFLPPEPPPPPDDRAIYYPSDRDMAIQLMTMATQLLNRKYNKWDMPPIYPLRGEDPPDA